MTNNTGRIELIDGKLHINGTVSTALLREAMETSGVSNVIFGSHAKIIGGIGATLRTEPKDSP